MSGKRKSGITKKQHYTQIIFLRGQFLFFEAEILFFGDHGFYVVAISFATGGVNRKLHNRQNRERQKHYFLQQNK